MSVLVGVIVVLGLIAVVLSAIAGGIQVTAIFVGVLIAAVGALAISVARKSRSGAVEPARCTECGGLISAQAPYCKHCGARVDA